MKFIVITEVVVLLLLIGVFVWLLVKEEKKADKDNGG